MGLYKRTCNECGYVTYENQFHENRDKCPACGENYSLMPSQIVQETAEEKEARRQDRVMGIRSALSVIVPVLATFLLAFPGILLVMLLHTMISIESVFVNWSLAILFSVAIFLLLKRNLISYVKLDIALVLCSMIISWCVSGFTPWQFAKTQVLSNGWLDAITVIASCVSIYFYNPQILIRFAELLNEKIK